VKYKIKSLNSRSKTMMLRLKITLKVQTTFNKMNKTNKNLKWRKLRWKKRFPRKSIINWFKRLKIREIQRKLAALD